MSVIGTYRDLVRAGEVTQDPAQELAVEMLERLSRRLKAYKPGRRRRLFGKPEPQPDGMYIFGDVGRGKSMLMDLFYDVAPVEPKRRVHFHAFMLEVHDAIFAWRQMDTKERAKQPNFVKEAGDDPIQPVAKAIAAGATLLCFDEFQVSDVADAMILSRLFEALLGFGVIVVATSNRAPSDLYADGLNRQLFLPFIALLEKELDVHHLDSMTDYRLNRIKGQPVYHAPLGTKADDALAQAFYALTDEKSGTPCELELKGRKLLVPNAAKGVARFTFAQLCENPLGAADYLAIAGAFHTVVLADIPQMSPEKRNEAKRFVTLIDALYENKIRLIASAASAPGELYDVGDGSFEFGRTVSRLIEMQSDDYLREIS